MGCGDIGGLIGHATDAVGLTNYGGDRAQQTQQDATNSANGVVKGIYDQQRADQEPWRQAGMSALTGMQDPSFQKSFTMADYQQDPGYQFRMNEGAKALNASAAANGASSGGATMKALTRYGQDYASNEYQNAYNRFNNDNSNRFNRLSSLAGLGQTANNVVNQNAGMYGQQVAGNQIGMGNAAASNQIAQTGRLASLFGQGAGAYGALQRAGPAGATGATGAAGASGGAAAGTGLLGADTSLAMFSDERLKENIKPITQEEMKEMKSILKAFHFNYINDSRGKGDWIGVMAQDLEKSKLGKTLVEEDSDGFKTISLHKIMSMFLATMAEG